MSSSTTTTSSTQDASKIHALKDQAVGAVKQAIGNVLGNDKLEIKGSEQKIQGKNEYELAKHAKAEESESHSSEHTYNPETYHSDASAEQHHTIPTPLPPTPLSSTAVHGTPPPAPGYNNPSSVQAPGSLPPPAPSQPLPPPAPSQPLPPSHHDKETSSSTTHDEPSKMSGWKDQAVGSVKEKVGSATNNPNMEMAGKAQNIHGHHETEFAKAKNEGLNEPQHFEHGTKKEEHAEGEVEDQKPSTLGALKDKTMGSMKEKLGSMTGNQDMELKGKAQNIHGHNEAEFVKAQKEGRNEPEHFAQGKKTTEHAHGEVEGDKVSSMSAMKDQALGSMKQTYGSATGNMNTELAGKAQEIHGRNEAEFAKAQKHGLNEPEHYAHGTKTTEHAQGEVVREEPSKISGWKDQAVGSMKETFASATNNPKMELEGKAQKMQGANECAYAETEKNTINA